MAIKYCIPIPVKTEQTVHIKVGSTYVNRFVLQWPLRRDNLIELLQFQSSIGILSLITHKIRQTYSTTLRGLLLADIIISEMTQVAASTR